MSDTSARLGLPFIAPSQAQKHVTHNEALQRLDALTLLTLEEVEATTPPATPDQGALYALGAGALGDWAGQDGQLAYWTGTGWLFLPPSEGWHGWDKSAGVMRVYQSGAWQGTEANLQNLQGLGIGASSDAVNRLSVASEASLFSHAGAGHQLKLNKAAAGDTASLLYQSNWSGHAEMGLTGDTDFHIRVSADGTSWRDALVVDSTTGLLTGDAIQQTATDAGIGQIPRILPGRGVFGLGLASQELTLAPDDNLDSLVLTGIYRFDATTTGAPFAGSGVVLHLGQVGNAYVQQAQASDGAVWSRGMVGGVWTNWAQSFTSANVVGPVSQVAGVPGGAVIETARNGNGQYVRYADGTQQCFHARSLFTSGAATWVFPAAFVEPPKVFGVAQQTTQALCFANETAPTATQARVSMLSSSSNRVGGMIDLMAIGRWYAAT
ncbi:MAG: DUF2793 domain-containing protein [Pseudomonadota bacterium]